MTKLVKIVDNKYVQIEEHLSPNICFNTNEYDDFENYCTLRKRFDPFEMFYENQKYKEVIDKAIEELLKIYHSLIIDTSKNIINIYKERDKKIDCVVKIYDDYVE
jgi:hypothetical protein